MCFAVFIGGDGGGGGGGGGGAWNAPLKMGLSLGLLVFYVTFNDISVIYGAEKYAGMQNALF